MKKHIQTLLSLFLLIALQAHTQENPQLPEAFRNTVSNDTTTISDIKWKQFLNEPDLTALIDAALAKNFDIQIAEKNLEIANLQYKEAKWGNVPQVTAFANASTTRFSDNSLNGRNAAAALGQRHIEDYSAGGTLSWEADIWGKIRNRKKSARANYLQTAEAQKALRTAIVASVSDGYYDLLMLDAQLEIARQTLKLSDSTMFIVGLQFDAGQVTSLAKQQTEAQRLVAAKLIPQLEQSIQVQENAISILAGQLPDAITRTKKLESIVINENLSAGIPTQLLSHRPDVKAAELALKAANANVGIAKASLYPSINITATGGVNSFDASNLFNVPASLFGSLAGGLTAPLINGKRLRTNYEIAKVQRDQAVISFKQAVLVAVAEVSDALARIDKQSEQYNFVAQRVGTLRTSVSNANMLFKNGMATYLEVIVAQGKLLDAELELAEVKKERLSSNVELYRALGGGWE
ncbi:MAG: efflux transporter outer membrane subunit [Flavobacterium sp.]|nr:MAG: efflux transporter outer membrane subunit [Flavobacterium sp.]